MKNNLFYTFMICLTIIISGCSDIKNSQDKETPLELTSSSKDVEVSNNMSFLKGTTEVVESANEFTQVKAFIPNEEYLQYEKVQGEDFQFIRLPENDSLISGSLIFENNTDENMKIQTLFLQGNKRAQIKTGSSEEWSSSILYDVPPKSSVKISIDINWDEKGMEELTFFPLDHTSSIDRYNGGNLSTFRYFVLDKDVSISQEAIKTQSFELEDLQDINNFIPIPTWIGIDKEDIEYIIKDEVLFTKGKISGLKLEPIPYDAEVDVLLIDEFGNSSILLQDVEILKDQSTIIDLSSAVLEKMNKSPNKNYIMIFNNRGIELLADLKALNMELKPFSTSSQTVIEFYKNHE